MPLQLNFGIAGVQDPTEDLSKALTNIGTAARDNNLRAIQELAAKRAMAESEKKNRDELLTQGVKELMLTTPRGTVDGIVTNAASKLDLNPFVVNDVKDAQGGIVGYTDYQGKTIDKSTADTKKARLAQLTDELTSSKLTQEKDSDRTAAAMKQFGATPLLVDHYEKQLVAEKLAEKEAKTGASTRVAEAQKALDEARKGVLDFATKVPGYTPVKISEFEEGRKITNTQMSSTTSGDTNTQADFGKRTETSNEVGVAQGNTKGTPTSEVGKLEKAVGKPPPITLTYLADLRGLFGDSGAEILGALPQLERDIALQKLGAIKDNKNIDEKRAAAKAAVATVAAAKAADEAENQKLVEKENDAKEKANKATALMQQLIADPTNKELEKALVAATQEADAAAKSIKGKGTWSDRTTEQDPYVNRTKTNTYSKVGQGTSAGEDMQKRTTSVYASGEQINKDAIAKAYGLYAPYIEEKKRDLAVAQAKLASLEAGASPVESLRNLATARINSFTELDKVLANMAPQKSETLKKPTEETPKKGEETKNATKEPSTAIPPPKRAETNTSDKKESLAKNLSKSQKGAELKVKGPQKNVDSRGIPSPRQKGDTKLPTTTSRNLEESNKELTAQIKKLQDEKKTRDEKEAAAEKKRINDKEATTTKQMTLSDLSTTLSDLFKPKQMTLSDLFK